MKADDVKGCFGNGTDNTDSLAYTVSSTSRADPIPQAWCGQFVRLRSVGAASFYFFSFSASASCDETLAAANDGGASPSRGELLPDGELVNVQVPYAPPNGGVVYLVRASTGTATLFAVKASGVPGVNTGENG